MDHERPACNSLEHAPKSPLKAASEAIEKASALFRALGDPARLRLLEYLMQGECCVTEMVEALGEKFSTISQRLRLLRGERLVTRRRAGTHLFYALADQHIIDLIQNALAHAAEPESVSAQRREPETSRSERMSHQHPDHDHTHGQGCGHTAVKHGDHVDYLHDGHLHHQAGGKVEDHAVEVSKTNPSDCTPTHDCKAHPKQHVHGPGCGHEAVPHGDHVDYLVDGHLHHPHGDHCDDHGPVAVVK